MDPKTIRQGLRELEEAEDAAAGRIRKKGGLPAANDRPAGPRSQPSPLFESSLLVIRCAKACCGPTCHCASYPEVSVLGTPASRRTIRRLLRKLKLGRRTARR